MRFAHLLQFTQMLHHHLPHDAVAPHKEHAGKTSDGLQQAPAQDAMGDGQTDLLDELACAITLDLMQPDDDHGVASSDIAPDSQPHGQQTTAGPEFLEMLEFMTRLFSQSMQQPAESDDTPQGVVGGGGATAAPPSRVDAMAQPAVAAPPAAPASPGAPPGADGTGPTKQMVVDGGGNHTIHLTNTSSSEIDLGAIKNAGPGMSPGNSVEAHVKLKPGESVDIKMPDDWQGRFQDLSGGLGGQSAWLEVNNEVAGDGKLGGIWFDAETTTGRDHSIKATSGGATAGDSNHLLQLAPDDLKTTNAAGQQVIKGAELGGVVNQAVVDFESQFEPAKGQSANGQYNTYIMPNNDTATRHSTSNTMDVEFGDA